MAIDNMSSFCLAPNQTKPNRTETNRKQIKNKCANTPNDEGNGKMAIWFLHEHEHWLKCSASLSDRNSQSARNIYHCYCSWFSILLLQFTFLFILSVLSVSVSNYLRSVLSLQFRWFFSFNFFSLVRCLSVCLGRFHFGRTEKKKQCIETKNTAFFVYVWKRFFPLYILSDTRTPQDACAATP